MSNYVNGEGQTSVVSGVLAPRFSSPIDCAPTWEEESSTTDYVQSAENTSTFDIDGDSTTKFDSEKFGNGSFRHFTKSITDGPARLGSLQAPTECVALATGARGTRCRPRRVPGTRPPSEVALFEAQAGPVGGGWSKGHRRPAGLHGERFWTKKKTSQVKGAVIDPVTGATTWIIVSSPEQGVRCRDRGGPDAGRRTPAPREQHDPQGRAGPGAGPDIGSRISRRADLAQQCRGDLPRPSHRRFSSKRLALGRQASRGHQAGTTLPSYNYFNLGAGYTLRPGDDHQFRPAEPVPE